MRDTWGPPDTGWPSFDAEGKRVRAIDERPVVSEVPVSEVTVAEDPLKLKPEYFEHRACCRSRSDA